MRLDRGLSYLQYRSHRITAWRGTRMPYNPKIHHRHSIRLRGFDYSKPGAYFVTMCTQHRQRLFGKIIDGKMILNDAGKMIEKYWNGLSVYYFGVDIDAFQIMQDHLHGIIVLKSGEQCDEKSVVRSLKNPAEQFVEQSIEQSIEQHVGTGPCACPDQMEQSRLIVSSRQTRLEESHLEKMRLELTQSEPTQSEQSQSGQTRGSAPTVTLSLSDVVQRFKTITTKKYIDAVHQNGWPAFPGKLWQRNYYERFIRNEEELSRTRRYILNNPEQWKRR